MTDKMFTDIGEGSSNRKKSMPSKLSPTSTNKKNIQCIECGFSCTSYAQLKVHNRIHTGDKPYECPDCSYASTRNANLQRHIASMHAGHYSSPATGKRGRPPNNINLTSPNQSDLQHIHSSLQSRTPSTTGNPNSDFIESITHGEHVKSPLSEIRAREIMLAENANQHDGVLPLDITQRMMDPGLRPRLLHPASQVLALPAHIALTQPSMSGYNTVVEEPIVIDDDPTVDAESEQNPSVKSGDLEGTGVRLEPQAPPPADKPIDTIETMTLPDDNVHVDSQAPAPVLIASTSTQEIINIEPPPLTTLQHKQNDRFGCILNDALSTTQVGHQLPVDEPCVPAAAAPGPSVVYQEIANSSVPAAATGPSVVPVYQEIANPSVNELTTAKFNQRQPLVLEIENSSIGLYLHLDLSKYLCKAARNWMSEHTQKCNDVCQANFPVNTSNAPDQVPLMEPELKETPQESVHTGPIMPMSNKVPTISKAPPIIQPSNHAQAFPTAILAVPQTSSNNTIENQPSEHHSFPNLNKTAFSRENNVDQGIPQLQPSLLKAALKQNSNSPAHFYKRKRPSNMVQNSGTTPTEHNSLLFQRWPTLKQYMQVRCLAGNQREFSCYKCGKQFPHLHQLKVHVKNHIKRYNCMQCHYSTHRMANLRRHQLTHRQIDELTCHVCGGVMANKRAYTMHVLFAHKKYKKKSKEFDIWRKQLSVSMSEASIRSDGMGLGATQQSTSTHQLDADNASGMSLDEIERLHVGEADTAQSNGGEVDLETPHQKEQMVADQDDNGQSSESANGIASKEVGEQSHTELTADSEEWNQEVVKKEPDDDDAENLTENGKTFIDDEQYEEESEMKDVADGNSEDLNDTEDVIKVKQELQCMDTL
ncbi:uncharacterized protein [Amphiura filiformis]|uniref:uncharacterized protein n=1 Tax=Amphiura filiformis TaxID=82378 RepID=UPI003B215C4B